jgi:F0F1-type ATP synthase delta subunit
VSVAFSSFWFDGEVMNHEITSRTELSTDQQKRLVNIISDQFGHTLTRETFTDQVLLLFEDISGFEMISDSESQTIINQLWSYYHGPDE